MRPDPRLLVPVSALPFVPGGCIPTKRCPKCSGASEANSVYDRTACDGDCRTCEVPMVTFVDASAPELRDGLPVRLDALPWLLRVLGWPRLGFINGAMTLTVEINKMVVGPEIAKHTTHAVQPWPDLTNLTPNEAARAVVVAAIVARGAK